MRTPPDIGDGAIHFLFHVLYYYRPTEIAMGQTMLHVDDRLSAMNRDNEEFWKRESALFKERFEDPLIRQLALQLIDHERLRRVPVYHRMTLESATRYVADARKSCLSEQAKVGGRSRKMDALQLLILEIVTKRPTISLKELEQRLHEHAGVRDRIICIEDGEILFTDRNREKSASVSGLKDRLTRAKKRIAQSR
jgi:hypothetical protein